MKALCIKSHPCCEPPNLLLAKVEPGRTYTIDYLKDNACKCPETRSGHAAVLVMECPGRQATICKGCKSVAMVDYLITCECCFIPLDPPKAEEREKELVLCE